MRKAFAALLALLVLAVCAIAGAAAAVTASATAVQLQHTTLYGDVAAAAGLRVESRLQCARSLFWHISYPLVENPGAVVSFESFLSRQRQPAVQHGGSGVQLSAYSLGGASTSGSFDEDWAAVGDPFASLVPVFQDVASRAPAGQEHTEIVDLGDYFDYYPLSVDVDIVGTDICLLPDGSQPTAQALSDAFARFFRIPVRQNNTLTVGVTKNAAGAVQGLDVYDPDGAGPELYGPSIVTPQAVYFALNFDAQDDVSHIPGGAGVYCLPYDAANTTGSGSADIPVIHPEQLCTVWPLQAGTAVVELTLSPQGTLLLVTKQEGWLYLTELELPSAPSQPLRQLARQPLLQVAQDGYVSGPVLFDDCLLVIEAPYGSFVLLQQDEQGLYKPVLTGDTTPAETAGMSLPFGPDMTFLWDGERLVAAQYMVQLYHDGCNDMYVSVFTADGLQYVGHIASSLSRNAGVTTQWSVYPDETDPLKLVRMQ